MDEEVKKQIDELVELNKQLLARVETAEAKAATADALEKKVAVLAKAAEGDACKLEDGSDGVMDANGECVKDEMEKRDALPEAIQKQLTAQDAEIKKAKERADASDAKIAKMEDDRIAKAYVDKASEYKHLPIKAEEFGPILRKAESALDDAGKAELNRVLKAATAAMQSVMGEKGVSGEGSGIDSAFAKLEAEADTIRKSDRKLTREQAFAKAMTDNPELARKVREEEARAH